MNLKDICSKEKGINQILNKVEKYNSVYYQTQKVNLFIYILVLFIIILSIFFLTVGQYIFFWLFIISFIGLLALFVLLNIREVQSRPEVHEIKILNWFLKNNGIKIAKVFQHCISPINIIKVPLNDRIEVIDINDIDTNIVSKLMLEKCVIVNQYYLYDLKKHKFKLIENIENCGANNMHVL